MQIKVCCCCSRLEFRILKQNGVKKGNESMYGMQDAKNNQEEHGIGGKFGSG